MIVLSGTLILLLHYSLKMKKSLYYGRVSGKTGINLFFGQNVIFEESSQFWHTGLVLHGKYRSYLFLPIFVMFSRKNICKKSVLGPVYMEGG